MKKLLIETPSKNLDWGFFGTLKSNYDFNDEQTAKIFEYAVASIAIRHDLEKSLVRDYLDSTAGRHFADDLSFYGAKRGININTTLIAIDSAWEASNWKKDLKRYIKSL